MSPATNPVILYDGLCGLCNRLNQFVLKRDQAQIFRFAALQSDFGRTILARHGADLGDLDTFYVVLNYEQPTERLLERSEAALFVLRQLGGAWRLATVLSVFPRTIRDYAYNLLARNRYRAFGKLDACPFPDEQHRTRFLDAKDLRLDDSNRRRWECQ